jgi:hypothetical protein
LIKREEEVHSKRKIREKLIVEEGRSHMFFTHKFRKIFPLTPINNYTLTSTKPFNTPIKNLEYL